MNQDTKDKIFRFLQDQITQAEFRTRAYVFDENNKKNPTRNAFVKLRMHKNNFLKGGASVRWLVIPGFRGTGKTTLLAQLYHDTDKTNINILYLSLDQVVQILGVTLNDVLTIYEEILGSPFEQMNKRLILFIDEVQYDINWAIVLKSLYDRSNKIFIIATGSSAVMLQNNPDVGRRAIFEKLYPMCFTEYVKIKLGKYEIPRLSKKIRDVIFNSINAQQVFDGLKKLENDARRYWLNINRMEIDKYIKYGTLPFMVALNNEALVYDQVKKTIDRVVSNDIPQIGQFSPEIVSVIPTLLYAIADSDQLSINTITKTLQISRPTIMSILDTLEKTETLLRIHPHGSHMAQARKPSKYLFSSPAFRSMYFSFIGSIKNPTEKIGKLLEDTIGLYLNRFLSSQTNTALTYDSAERGADFIIRFGNENIIAEIGMGKKDCDQVEHSMKRIKAKYGLVISMSPLRQHGNCVYVPLSYFLLV